MSPRSHSRARQRRPTQAALFAALGDETRLALVGRLVAGQPESIAELTAGSHVTRQAITKHLRVLEKAGLVQSVRTGRENRFALDPRPLYAMQRYLDRVSGEWDQALARLRAFVEN